MARPRKVVKLAAAGMIAFTMALVGCGNSQPVVTAVTIHRKAAEGQTKRASTDYLVLVNGKHKLPDDWEAKLDLVEEPSLLYDDPVRVERGAYEAFQGLKAELAKEGVDVELDSCYRSTKQQQEIVDEFTKQYGKEYVERYVAVPGYSEHHTGLALDLFLVINGEKVAANEDMVLRQDVWDKVHARLADHGFILRYLQHKESITGCSYEPWHIRYVGDPKVAHAIMDAGLTFEEYLGDAEPFEGVSNSNYEIDFGTSDVYTEDDIRSAVDVVMTTFNGWSGCRMKRIAYGGDEASKAELEYTNSHLDKNEGPYDQAIVIVTDFHSPSAEDAEGSAWEPDADYNDYTWTLVRMTGGGWRLINWGYA